MDIDTKHQKLFKLVGFKWKQLVETDKCYKYLATKMDKAKSTLFYLKIHSIQFVFDIFILYTIHFVIMTLNFSIFICICWLFITISSLAMPFITRLTHFWSFGKNPNEGTV